MNITFFGTYDTTTTPRVQGLIDGLRAHGIKVTECNVPLKVDTATRVKILHEPWRLPLLAIHIIGCWIKLSFKARHLPGADAVVVGYMGQFDVHLARILFGRKPLALDYMVSGSDTARDRRASSTWKDKLLRWLDNSALKTADIVVLDSEEHRQALPDKYRDKGVVVNVGAPDTWFEAGKGIEAEKYPHQPLRVIFFGAFTPLQGAPVIGQAISRLTAPVEITMVGKGQDLETMKAEVAKAKSDKVKIDWSDWIDAAKLPAVVANHDVCLGIFGTGTKSYKVVPNKVYGGAAAGCAIITSGTPPQRRVLGDSVIFVPPGDPKALAEALDGLASRPVEVNKFRKAAHERALAKFTPKEVTRPLLERLKTAP